MLRIEMSELLPAASSHLFKPRQARSITKPWSTKKAEARFVKRFRELGGKPEKVSR
jgi:hypothetical protein